MTVEKRDTKPDALQTMCKEYVQLKSMCMVHLTMMGIEPDHRSRAPWEKKAKFEDAYAQFIVGSFHMTGYGIPEDVKKAAEYFREGAAHGQNTSMVSFAVMLFKGIAVEPDHKEAYFWISLAVSFHLPESPMLQSVTGLQTWIGEGLALEDVREVRQRVASWRPKAPMVGTVNFQIN